MKKDVNYTAEELDGLTFYHFSDKIGTKPYKIQIDTFNTLRINWTAEDGHGYNGSAIYSLVNVNEYINLGHWILKDFIAKEGVSNYSIF